MNIQSAVQQADIGNTRENAAVATLRQNFDQTQKLNKTEQQTSMSAPANETRGTLLDILV